MGIGLDERVVGGLVIYLDDNEWRRVDAGVLQKM